ncbi:MAG: diphosphomevalonate/mevalonate 3,5-bisphosphate decarboxylase family protein [Flavobacteriaceae bacterium]
MVREFVFNFKKKNEIFNGESHWKAPSNIALIKYWGKKSNQIPINPSLSFALKNCYTQTKVSFVQSDNTNLDFDFFFEGNRKKSFENKLKKYFKNIIIYCSYLSKFKLKIESSNSFPHSSGIASSASSYCALSLCIMDIEKKIDPSIDNQRFLRKASFLARLGSGSACRSTKGSYSMWGKSNVFPMASNLFSIEYPEKVNEIFNTLCDTILIVDKQKKKFSSTDGHMLMQNHPFSIARISQAKDNLLLIKNALELGDLKLFIKVVETEALSLHSMMMTSDPQFILMKPNTLKIIDEIWEYRKKTKSNVCFTLDAGANVHLIYPQEEFDSIQKFINLKLLIFCESGKFINDKIGIGPLKL